MATRSRVKWLTHDVMVHFKGMSRQALEAVAFHIEGEAKQNIITNDQVDTGFMVNTVYVKSEAVNTYEATKEDGLYTGQKSGAERTVQKAPEATLPADVDVLVAIGADYAIFQELLNPFLYPALVSVSQQAKGIIQQVAKQNG